MTNRIQELRLIAQSYEDFVENGVCPEDSPLRIEAKRNNSDNALGLINAGLHAYRELYLLQKIQLGDFRSSLTQRLEDLQKSQHGYTSSHELGYCQGLISCLDVTLEEVNERFPL